MVKQEFLLLKLALWTIYFVCIFIDNANSTISPGDKSQKQPKPLKVKTGPRDESVFDLDLIDIEPSAREILINSGSYYKNTAERRFNGTVLGFVTPVSLNIKSFTMVEIYYSTKFQWNGHGYEVAKTFARKFDVISPVWFQIVKDKGKYKINGLHDVDARWMKDVRSKRKTGSTSMQCKYNF